MSEPPEIWHYGLMAERWAEALTDAPELDFLNDAISRYGEPVLEVACGTGRLLLPLAQAGVDIDGVEFSGDMLAHCRRKVEKEDLSSALYQQSMAELDLPRTYRTMYIIDSFGLTGSRRQDLEALRHCYAHLESGGALILNIQAEYTSEEAWRMWATENARELPQPWPDQPRDRSGSDGIVHRAYFRLLGLDPLEQTYTRQVRLEKWVEGAKVASEEYVLTGNMYLKHELMLMLRTVGFSTIDLVGDYSQSEATVTSEELVFTAIK